MGKLSDILNGGAGNFDDTWNSTPAAGDFGPLPRGVYICHATNRELEKSISKGTPCYKLEFTVIEGEFKGRKLWDPLWLSAAALPGSKRDLAKLSITSPGQMEQPLPRWFRCRVTATVRRGDDGIERNEVRNFDVLGFDRPEADPFAPPGPSDAGDLAAVATLSPPDVPF